jgi:hypothetical protein
MFESGFLLGLLIGSLFTLVSVALGIVYQAVVKAYRVYIDTNEKHDHPSD